MTHNAERVGVYQTFLRDVVDPFGKVPGVSTFTGGGRAAVGMLVAVAESFHLVGLSLGSVVGTKRLRGRCKQQIPSVENNIVAAGKHVGRGILELPGILAPGLRLYDQKVLLEKQKSGLEQRVISLSSQEIALRAELDKARGKEEECKKLQTELDALKVIKADLEAKMQPAKKK